ncbi:MAG: hypothetical protein AAGC71_00055 [Pseudomonadota bacterium]
MSSDNDDFYVGYLPTPPRLVRWYSVLVPLLIAAAGGFGFWLAGSQQAVGEGAWAFGDTSTIEGTLNARPYPHVVTPSGDSVLLVREGKRGVDAWAEALDGQSVQVSGFAIERGTWRMLEIASADAMVATSTIVAPQSEPLTRHFGENTLRGEIVDSKCFLGVMKPGNGLVHRACAELCVRGGMPPMLIAESASGERAGYLLVTPDGGSAKTLVAGKVGVPITVSGSVTAVGTLRYLSVTAATITLQTVAATSSPDWCRLPASDG